MASRVIIAFSLGLTLASSASTNSATSRQSKPPQEQGRSFGFGGFGFRPFYGGFPGFYPGGFGGYPGGYFPGAFRPGVGGFRPGGYPGGAFGGYPQYPIRPGSGGVISANPGSNRPTSGVNRPTPSGVTNNGANTQTPTIPNLNNLTPSQAAALGQALGSLLRPLLNGGGAGATGDANPLAGLLG